MADYRAAIVGFVFQFYNLIQTLTIYEKVALVQDISKNALDPKKMIEEVGRIDHLKNFSSELSGGEQQRGSIARALAKNYGKTLVIVTHNQNIAKMADVVIRVKNGTLQSYEEQENPMVISALIWKKQNWKPQCNRKWDEPF